MNTGNNENHNHIFNMKILVDARDVGWKNDYKEILNYLSKFPHIKIEEKKENSHWRGVTLCSTDFTTGLKPAKRTGNNTNKTETGDVDNTDCSIALSQYVFGNE